MGDERGVENGGATGERRGGEGTLDLALLTDGLRAEREQGITIDVAYRYFATPRRRFIIADCPGHRQYTRNMVTGASTADVSVVLIDARRGVLEQSKRHAFLSALLGIPQMVVAINKMDLVDYSQARYEELIEEFEEFANKLRGGKNPRPIETSYIAMSALNGDNVVERSTLMDWYDGPVLLDLLDREMKSEFNMVLNTKEIQAGFTVKMLSTQAGELPLIPDWSLAYTGTPGTGSAVLPAYIVTEDLIEYHWLGDPTPRIFELGRPNSLSQQYVAVKFGAVVVKGASFAHTQVLVDR